MFRSPQVLPTYEPSANQYQVNFSCAINPLWMQVVLIMKSMLFVIIHSKADCLS